MDIEKQIEGLKTCARLGDSPIMDGFAVIADKRKLDDAATALSTLQAENSQLRESRDHWKRLAHELSEGVNGKDAEHERLQAENEKLRADVIRFNDMLSSYQNVLVPELRAELEQVKAERDAAIKDIWVPKWISCKNGENCSFVSAITGMPDCAGCDNWEWRGQKED